MQNPDVLAFQAIFTYTFGPVWIPCGYLPGAGRFLGCFHPAVILKIEWLKKYLPDWPQIFR